MLPLLNGMFSIAIMDLRSKKLYLARDRFGIKPLYYSCTDQNILFASELKCFIQFEEFKRKLDIDAFNARLIFSRPSSKVLLHNVKMMDPGQALCMEMDGKISIWNYFDIDSYERDPSKFKNIEDAIASFDEVLINAVQRQLVSDVKVGCQVSGGIDSTIVSYYANKIKGKNLEDGVSIIDDAGNDGEEYYINQVGINLGLDLHKFKLTEKFFLDNYENLVWYNDAPLYKPFFTSFYKLTQGAKKYVTVLMSGEGSDEIAGGYGRFAAGVYQPFLSQFGTSSRKIKSYKSYAEYAVMTDSTITGFTTKGYTGAQNLIDEQIDIFNHFRGSNFTKQLKFETMCRLPESFMRQDKMSMANSIENRVPLVDNEVVDFIMELPEEMLLRFKKFSPTQLSDNPFEWVQGKFIFKELCAKKFGYDFAYRKKAIMVFDERNMLASDGFRELFYENILPSMQKRDLVDVGYIKSLYENVQKISKNEFNCMWRAVGLETWCQLFLDKKNI